MQPVEALGVKNRRPNGWITSGVATMDFVDSLWWTNKKQWKDPPFFMGKSTISMAMFNCYVSSPEDSWRLVNMLINAILYGTLAATCCEMLRNVSEWSPKTATDQLEVIERLSWEPICNDLSWYLSISRNMPLDVWPFNNYILQRQPLGGLLHLMAPVPQQGWSLWTITGWRLCQRLLSRTEGSKGFWTNAIRIIWWFHHGVSKFLGRTILIRNPYPSLSSSVFRNTHTHTNTKKQLSTAGMIPEVSKK